MHVSGETHNSLHLLSEWMKWCFRAEPARFSRGLCTSVKFTIELTAACHLGVIEFPKNCEPASLRLAGRPGRNRHRGKQAVSGAGSPYDPPLQPLSKFQSCRRLARESKSQESHRASTTHLNLQPECPGGTSSGKSRRSSPLPQGPAAHAQCEFASGLCWFDICRWGRARVNLEYSINQGVTQWARPRAASYGRV